MVKNLFLIQLGMNAKAFVILAIKFFKAVCVS